MIGSPWKSVLIDVSEDAKNSEECNLGNPYAELLIIVPTITTAQISIQVAKVSGGTFQDLYTTDPADGGNNKLISASGAGGFTWRIPFGFQFLKIVSSADQGEDRTFAVQGINP